MQVVCLPLIAGVERSESQEAVVAHQAGGPPNTQVQHTLVAAGDENAVGRDMELQETGLQEAVGMSAEQQRRHHLEQPSAEQDKQGGQG